MSKCVHAASGMCRNCTFDWMRAELDRLRAENEELRVHIMLLEAHETVKPLVERERRLEHIGDLKTQRLRSAALARGGKP